MPLDVAPCLPTVLVGVRQPVSFLTQDGDVLTATSPVARAHRLVCLLFASQSPGLACRSHVAITCDPGACCGARPGSPYVPGRRTAKGGHDDDHPPPCPEAGLL